MMPAAGQLNRRITLQQNAGALDAAGEQVPNWQNLSKNPTVWAAMEPLTERELVQADRVLTTQDKAFMVRYRTDVTPKMRLIFDGKNYDIHSITEIGLREGLRIVARAVD